MKDKLTVKQQKFADEYIKTGNATQSAINAGYSEKTAQQTGSENLLKPVIKRYIEQKMREIESHKIADAKEALEGITSIARGEAKAKIFVGISKLTEDPIYQDTYPTITERQRAWDSILKRFPLSDLDKAQIRKVQAEAVRAEAEAEVAKAQAQQLHTIADKTAKKMEKLSEEDLRNLAKMVGEEDDQLNG